MSVFPKHFLAIFSTTFLFACGNAAQDDEDSDEYTGTGAEPNGQHQSGGTGFGGEGEDRESGGTGGGSGASDSEGNGGSKGNGGSEGGAGSPNPEAKPDLVSDYPCMGESRTYEVDDVGKAAELPSEITRFTYDDRGHIIVLLTDGDGDATFDTGRYSEYDSAGRLTIFDYDNNGDTLIDSRAVYGYNSEDEAISVDYFSPLSTLVSYYTLEYDTRGRRTLMKEFRASDDFELRRETSDWISDWEYDFVQIRGGDLREVSHVVLNQYGDVLSKEVWADAEKAIWVSTTTITYDSFGRPTTEEVESDAALQITTNSYGETGLMSEQEVHEDKGLVRVVKYEYFDECR